MLTEIKSWEKDVIESPIPVIVDVSSEWCMPCKAMIPVLEDLATEYEGKIKFLGMDVEKHRDIVTSLDIKAVPTILFIYGQKEFNLVATVEKLVGARSKIEIKTKIEEILGEHRDIKTDSSDRS